MSARGGQTMGSLGRWWYQPDQFDWLSRYLHARGLAAPTKILMAVVSAALMGAAAVGFTTRTVPFTVAATYAVLAVAVGFGYAVLWLRRWPTRAQSLGMAVGGAVLIAAGCLLQSEPLLALMGCTSMVIIGGYAGFFHNTKTIAVTVLIAAAAGVLCALRVAETEGWGIAGPGLWLVIELNVAVPLAIQAVVRTLGEDVVRSDQDPLTGLLNRRAFYERARTLLTSPGNDLHLIVVMVDLDKFKLLNDVHGHLAGDQALTAVGWALRQATARSALVGRFGGEEFIVIDTLSLHAAEALPLQLCTAIAALPHPVTASVGAAIIRWGNGPAIDELIRIADTAMYAAKRDGGNRCLISRPLPN